MEKEATEVLIGLNCLKAIGILATAYLSLILGVEFGVYLRYRVRGGGLYFHQMMMNRGKEMLKNLFNSQKRK